MAKTLKIQLSKRVQSVKPSPTLAVTARARALRAAGKDVIGLGAGEPDFDTPDHIKEAAIKAIHDGQTKYTAVDGTPELKQAIVDKFTRENNLNYDLKQVMVTAGGKQGFYNLAQALLNPGDEVIIPAPYWVSYPDMVILAEGTPVIISAGIQQGFKITPQQLESAITPKTRFVVINSPSNPTGVAYTIQEMKALGDVLLKHPHVLVVTDDIYEHILWSQPEFKNILNVCPELYERGIVLNGVSKAYSMTGWRIGYAAGPAEIISAMKKIQSQSTSNPASISQAAAVAALNGDSGFMREMCKVFRSRHDFIVSELRKIKDVTCAESDGTFYAFPDFQKVIDNLSGINSDVELAEALIEKAGVALVPGSAFGAPGHLRLSYATDMETLKKAMQRLQDFLKS